MQRPESDRRECIARNGGLVIPGVLIGSWVSRYKQMRQGCTTAVLDTGIRRYDECAGLANDLVVQIEPLWIGGLDQFDLPGALPFLDGLLARAGGFDGLVQLDESPSFRRKPESRNGGLVIPGVLIASWVSRCKQMRRGCTTAVLDTGVRRYDGCVGLADDLVVQIEPLWVGGLG